VVVGATNRRSATSGSQLSPVNRRLAVVYEARGDRKQAAEYYRKALDLMRDNADSCDPDAIDWMRKKAESLEHNR
jgi:tetratricopeptide (TPR) repeat protein